MLRTSLIAGGGFLAGFDRLALLLPLQTQKGDPFRGGRKLGDVDFLNEVPMEMGTVVGAELDGRLYTDLSALSPEKRTTPPDQFYLRTCASKLLDSRAPWTIRVGGLVRKPAALSDSKLRQMEGPQGIHVMECAGNTSGFHFGLMSAASWSGIAVSEILKTVSAEPLATHVLVSGFDAYKESSTYSIPGASWIFTLEELQSSRSFLATRMGGAPLTADHGAPFRLIVPGWYGCTCVKWVNEITLMADIAPATSQMREYAARTHQQGVPELARDFRPAIIQHAAIPIRVERWLVGNNIKYRVVGILWGGPGRPRALEIRFNPDEDYVPVDSVEPRNEDSWSFWTHAWTPQKPGEYLVRLRLRDAQGPTTRLDSGYYVRALEITN